MASKGSGVKQRNKRARKATGVRNGEPELLIMRSGPKFLSPSLSLSLSLSLALELLFVQKINIAAATGQGLAQPLLKVHAADCSISKAHFSMRCCIVLSLAVAVLCCVVWPCAVCGLYCVHWSCSQTASHFT